MASTPTAPDRPTVLYVDDEADNLAVFEALYGELFEVVTARSGAEAVEILRRRPVAVLLTDQRMPGMSGIDVTELCQREYPDTVRILVTGYADLGAVVDAINRGAIHRYVRKPWDPLDLELALRESVSVYELRRRMQDLERSLHESGRLYALGVVAASVAHELAQPLTVLLGDLDLARSTLRRVAARSPDPDLDEVGSLLGQAGEAATMLSEVVQGIRTSTRPQPADELVDITSVVPVVFRMVQGMVKDHARLEFDARPAPEIRGSRTRVGQALLNLVVNALQALPADRADRNVVRVGLRAAGTHTEVVVEDNGPGIRPEDRQRIFDPFFTTRPDSGTGLGLAITRRIVEDLGGRMTLDESYTGGARFKLSFPAA